MTTTAPMPRKGFFPAYVKYGRTQTDAPDLFHLGTALAMFSAAVARTTVLIPPHGVPLPLHLWVLLVGTPAERKSTHLSRHAAAAFQRSCCRRPATPLCAE